MCCLILALLLAYLDLHKVQDRLFSCWYPKGLLLPISPPPCEYAPVGAVNYLDVQIRGASHILVSFFMRVRGLTYLATWVLSEAWDSTAWQRSVLRAAVPSHQFFRIPPCRDVIYLLSDSYSLCGVFDLPSSYHVRALVNLLNQRI